MITNYKETDYQGIRFGKYHGMFTNDRLDRTNLPKDVFAYDMRHSGSSGKLISVEDRVVVNHGGTVLLPEPVKMSSGRDYYSLRNWTFTDENVKKGEIDNWLEKERAMR